MAVHIRLKRVGTTKWPHWRIVAADSRSPRDGRFIDQIGYYNPKTNPATIEIDSEKLSHWMKTGAQPSIAVRNLVKQKGLKNLLVRK
jgi:small subunit ribosomal protein S16